MSNKKLIDEILRKGAAIYRAPAIEEVPVRKREKRVRKELHRIGTKYAHHGWAARQASKRHNTGAGKRRLPQ